MRYIPAGASTPVFHMDRTEVTAGQFKKFLQESEYSYEGDWNAVSKFFFSGEHPMIFVNLV